MARPHYCALAILALAPVLSACVAEKPSTPPYYENLARVDAAVDLPSAQQMISQYRRNNGLGNISPDPALTAIAREKAQAMANEGNVKASQRKDQHLDTQMAAIGESKTHAVENVSGGYRTFAEAFSGWRESPKHNAVMLDKEATRFGLATAYAPNAKHKVFWSLIMAGPRQQ